MVYPLYFLLCEKIDSLLPSQYSLALLFVSHFGDIFCIYLYLSVHKLLVIVLHHIGSASVLMRIRRLDSLVQPVSVTTGIITPPLLGDHFCFSQTCSMYEGKGTVKTVYLEVYA